MPPKQVKGAKKQVKQVKKEVKKQVKKQELLKKQVKKQAKKQPKKQEPKKQQAKKQQTKKQAEPKLQWKNIDLKQLLTYATEKHVSLIRNPDGNVVTFFKYKGTLLEISDIMNYVKLGSKTIEKVDEDFRKLFLFSVSKGDFTCFDLGGEPAESLQFLSKLSWFSAEHLIRTPSKMNSAFWQSKVVKPDDANLFGNKGKDAFIINPESKIVLVSSTAKDKIIEITKQIGGNQWMLLNVANDQEEEEQKE